ncbi:MAG: GTPase [Candidatus Latescibacteria bacterium]|nr:GTPase [Candidatus Latescibacterota bacterium]NIO56754.1 GTPase [Candidatus Latescibacterota bacterium]NIT02339.1 GTPase [Candidatus Latescibacterota bacterium]NIT39222.1 GTPase [Candidatus Latescibacterota bacterium]
MVGETHRTHNGQVIRIDCFWRDLLSHLEKDRSWRSVFVAGPVDSGKSTLCRFLGEHFAVRFSTAAIDCDPGQSILGPPATLALAWEPRKSEVPLAMRFIGSNTPSGHFLQALTSMKRLSERAFEEGAQKIVFDSCGYPVTAAGREFFYQTLDLLEPDHLVALQQIDEMEPLLATFTRRNKPRLHRLPISEEVIRRSRTERRAYRQQKFKRYFKNAKRQMLPLEGMGLHGMIPALKNPQSWDHCLVALCDRKGFAVAIGVLEKVEMHESRLWIHAPPFDRNQIASVQFGSLRVDHRSGEEL